MKAIGMFSVLALTAVAGCDDLTADAVKLHVTKGAVASPPALQAALIWANTAGSPDVSGPTAITALPANFPASFALALGEPPPANLLNDYTKGGLRPHEAKIGIAVIAAAPADYDFTGDEEASTFAVSSQFVVAWVDRDLEPGTFSAALVGGPLERGYHLLRATPAEAYVAAHPAVTACETFESTCELPADTDDKTAMTAYFACEDAAASEAGCLAPSPSFDRLAPAAGGFGTTIELELTTDPDERNAPNWT